MHDGQQLLIRRIDGDNAIIDVGGAEQCFRVLPHGEPCPHGALEAGRTLAARVPDQPEKPSALAGTRVVAPCECDFILIPDTSTH